MHKNIRFVISIIVWPIATIIVINGLSYLLGLIGQDSLVKSLPFIAIAAVSIIITIGIINEYKTEQDYHLDKKFKLEDISINSADVIIAKNNVSVRIHDTEELGEKHIRKNSHRAKLIAVLKYLRIFAIPILFIGALLLLWYLFTLIPYKRLLSFILYNNIIVSFVIMLALFQFTLRKKFLQRQTWKKLTDVWLKWAGVSTLTVGGFGFLAVNDTISLPLLKITSEAPWVNLNAMTTIYSIIVVVSFFSGVCTVIGRANSEGHEYTNNIPKSWFIPAFILTWVSVTAQTSLVLCSIILTFHAHLTNP